MRYWNWATTRALACATLTAGSLLTGCARNEFGATPPSPALPPARAARPAMALVYVSDDKRNVVSVFDESGKPAATIATGLNYPQGLYVDGAHDLWVANQGDSDVLEYKRGASSPIARLADNNNLPNDVTMCPDGTIYVANVFSPNGGGDITVYAPAKHRVSRTLGYANSEFTFVTCDAKGNVFATGVTGTLGSVIVFPGGHQKSAKMLPITGGGNLGGIKVDRGGNLLVDDPSGTVSEYTPPGKPTGLVVRTAGWSDIALDAAGTTLFGADIAAQRGIAVSFPGGSLRHTYRGGFQSVVGIAVDGAP